MTRRDAKNAPSTHAAPTLDLREDRSGTVPTNHAVEFRGIALLIVAAVLWSLNGLFIKSLNAAGLGGLTIAAYRSLFACLILTPFALKRPHVIAEPAWVVATVLAFTGLCATFVVATTYTTAANAIILQYVAPVVVFLLAPFITRERATPQQMLALILSLIGVGIIFGSQYAPGQTGLVIGLSSGIIFGVQSVLFRRVRSVDSLVLTWLVCGGSGVILLVATFFVAPAPPAPRLALWLAVMGIVQFGLPYILYSAAIKHLTAQQAVLIILLETILNPVWVWLVVGEIPAVSTLVGGAFILASVLYLSLLRRAPFIRLNRRPPTA